MVTITIIILQTEEILNEMRLWKSLSSDLAEIGYSAYSFPSTSNTIRSTVDVVISTTLNNNKKRIINNDNHDGMNGGDELRALRRRQEDFVVRETLLDAVSAIEKASE